MEKVINSLEALKALSEMTENAAVDFAMEVAATQAEGYVVTEVETSDIIRTIKCHRGGECGCFPGLVNKLMHDVEALEDEDSGEPELDALPIRIVAGSLRAH